MKISVDSDRTILLEDVYSGVGLKTPAGEFMGICMRDGGFEFNYGGVWYSAKGNVITPLPTFQTPCFKEDCESCEKRMGKDKE